MKNFLKFFTFFILLFLSISSGNAYIDKSNIIGELKFNSLGAIKWYNDNITYIKDSSQKNTYSNSISSPPYGYLSSLYDYGANQPRYGSKLNFNYSILPNILSYSFWSSNIGLPVFSNNGIELKTVTANTISLFIDGEKISDIPLSSGWHLYTITLDKTKGKINIYIDGLTQSYSYNTDKQFLFTSSEQIIRNQYSTLRIYNKVLNNDEISDLYFENINKFPSLTSSGVTTINYTSPIDTYNLNIGKITDIDSSIIDIEYSINGGQYLKYNGLSYNKPNNQDVILNLPSNLFTYGNNTLSIRAYDGIIESNILTFTINNNYFPDITLSGTTLVGNYYFNNNLLSQTGTNNFTGSSINYFKSMTFPYSYISGSTITYNSSTITADSMSFYVKGGSGEILNNNYFSITNDTTNGFSFIRGGINYLKVGPKDNNWHFMVLKLDKVNDILYVDIDNGQYKGNIMYYRDDLLANLSFKNGAFAFLKTFSQQLSSEQISTLFGFYDYSLTTISSLTGSLNTYTNIPFMIKDTRSNITFSAYYSLDGINFNKVDNFSLSTPLSSTGVYNVSLGGSGMIIGQNNVYIKLYDGLKFSNTLTYVINKTSNNSSLTITIDDSGIFKGGDKIIKATSNAGNLFYSITKESVCDETLNFLPYKDLTFSSMEDNGSKVCYKAVLYDEIVYSLSRTIDGIGDKTSTVKNSDIFYNYFNWKKGSLKDFDPLYILIKSIVSKNIQGTSTSLNYPTLLTDVNGDGLPDIVLTNYYFGGYYYLGADGKLVYSTQNSNNYFYALLLNKGNMDFEVKYRCIYIQDGLGAGYYGDCAQ